MEFTPFFVNLSPIASGLLDAGVLVVLFAPPLWLLLSQSLGHTQTKSICPLLRGVLIKIFFSIITFVFIVQFSIMILVPKVLPGISEQNFAMLDATLTTLFVLPTLWWMLTRLNQHYPKITLSDFLKAPMVLFFMFLYMIFLADLAQEVILPHETANYSKIIDAVATTLFTAPFFWLLIGRPLTRAVQSERTRGVALRDQVVDAIISLNAEGLINSMNPAAEAIFGFKSSELTGQPVEILFLEEQTSVQKLLSAFSKDEVTDEDMIFREVVCTSRNKSRLTMDISVSSIIYFGQREWLLILRDISERIGAERALRESDARFRQIFEQSEDAIMFFKPETCDIIDVNTTCTHLFGYSKSEIISSQLADLFIREDFDRVSNTIREIDSGTPARMENFTGVHKNGTKFILSIRGKLMILNGINVVFCSFRDITSRVRLEKEAKDIQARLIQTNKMTSLGLLVSGVAHEINNPNNFIMSNSRLLANTWDDTLKILRQYHKEHGDFYLGGLPFAELDEHTPKLFSGIMDGSRRINEIVNNLKRFYRQEQSEEGHLFDINQVTNSAISLLHHELINYTENFHTDLADDLPSIKGNAQQLGQVIINLLMNACQSLPERTRSISLTTELDAEHAFVVLSITDEGRGMSLEDSRKIMDPFFTTKLDSGGTGLGLSICRSIIMEHKGILEFDSEPEKGSTFIVKLPIATKD